MGLCGNFTILNYPVILSHRRNTTVSYETYFLWHNKTCIQYQDKGVWKISRLHKTVINMTV